MKRKIRTLTITCITIVVAALVTLSTTAASAATTTASAPGHVTAPRAAAATGCVTEEFTEADENTYEPCVRDEQVLLNNLWNAHPRVPGPNQLLTVDGSYGSHTYSDVRAFQTFWGDLIDGKTGPETWATLCSANQGNGFTGVYWHDAGCNTL